MTDAERIESRAANSLLLDNGVSIKAGRREFIIKESYLGTLFHLSKLYLKMGFDEEKLSGNAWLTESKRLYQFAPVLAEIVAVAILNNKWKIRLFSRLLTKYLLWHLTPQKMVEVSTLIVFKINNLEDFLGSIRLTAGLRITTPKNLSPDDNGG